MKFLECRILVLFLALFLSVAGAAQVNACVGKTLVIGKTDRTQQTVLAEVVALLISERTGTTVKIESFQNLQEIHQAQLKAEIDIAIGYTGLSLVEVLKGEPIRGADELFQFVKARYNEEMNLIWLEPFGFEQSSGLAAGVPDQAAPLVRKDTLKKFPALARLINKLGGTIDQTTIAALEEETREKGARDVARKFLRDNRLI